MYIHTVKEGESVYSIAGEYGISPAKIIENNGLKNPDRLAVGRELLILVPTRTYTARRGDTLGGIAKRFSVTESEMRKNNPTLSGRSGIYPEEVFAVKYPAKMHGIALLNGYAYKGTTGERLNLLMPYLSHVTVSSKHYKGARMHTLFDGSPCVKAAKALGKRVLLRIYTEDFECGDKKQSGEFIASAIKEAKAMDCDGITFNLPRAAESEKLSEFLFGIKKAALAEGLSLSVEFGGKILKNLTDTVDSVIINYDKALGDFEKSFDESERSFYTEAAGLCDTTRAFADLSPFAYLGNNAFPIEEAERIADRGGLKTDYDSDSMLCKYKTKEGEVIYPSLKNIKARLELCSELGFLGYSVDIMSVPVAHLMMLSSMFQLAPDYFSGGI